MHLKIYFYFFEIYGSIASHFEEEKNRSKVYIVKWQIPGQYFCKSPLWPSHFSAAYFSPQFCLPSPCLSQLSLSPEFFPASSKQKVESLVFLHPKNRETILTLTCILVSFSWFIACSPAVSPADLFPNIHHTILRMHSTNK